MKRQDQRSVGELLLDADSTTRQLLMDATGQDAPAMLRTWGEVVQSASELWATLPQPFRGTTSPIDGVTIARLESMSQSMHRDQVRRGWPGDGPGDERLLRRAMKGYLRFVNAWYSKEFIEVFLYPQDVLQIPPAVNAVLGGNISGSFAIRWRMSAFYFIVWLQRYLPLCPRRTLVAPKTTPEPALRSAA